MKEKTTNRKRVKGTVLFTVVSVMMVLLVFLTATLALAVTANKRAYTAYQQEQTEYTAKAVLEAVNRQVASDTDGSGIRGDIVGLQSTDPPMEVNIEIDDGTVKENHTVLISNTGEQRSIYENNAWKKINVYQLSVTVSSSTTSASSTYESFLAMDVVPGSTTTTTITTINPGGGDGGAFVSLGDTGGNELATKGYTTGGTYLGIKIPNYSYTMSSSGANVIDAPFYVNGDLSSGAQPFVMHFTQPDDFMIVRGNFTFQNLNSISTSFAGYDNTGYSYESTPFIYVDGAFNSPGSKCTIGDASHAVNVFCGSMSIGQNGFEHYGDLYIMDEVKSTIDTQAAQTKLYKWTGGTLNRAEGFPTNYGNIYSMGSLEITSGNGLIVQGNVQINGDLTVSKLEVTGDVIVNGTLKVNGSLKAAHVLAGNIEGTSKIDASAINAVTKDGAAAELDVTKLTAKASHTYKTWYENVWTDPANESSWASGSGYFKASYDKHVEIDGVAQPVETVGATDLVGWTTGVDTTAFSSFAEYAASVNETVKGLLENNGVANAKTETRAAGYDLSNSIYFGQDVYPSNYTKAYLNSNKLDQPEAVDYETMYKPGVENLDASLFDKTQMKYNIPVYKIGGDIWVWDSETSSNVVYSQRYQSKQPAGDVSAINKGSYYEVNTNCVLSGASDKDIYINGSTDAITVIMDSVSIGNDHSIIVNDANMVTIYIVNTLSLGQRASLITTDYYNILKGTPWTPGTSASAGNVIGGMANDITVKQVQSIGDPGYPSVVINSDRNSVMNIDMNSFVTALIRAPKLVFQSNAGSSPSKGINYELPTGKTVRYGNGYNGTDASGNKVGISNCDGCASIGLIGQLIAGQIKLPSNGSWGMLYITDPNSSGIHPGSRTGSTTTTTTTTTAGTSSYSMLYSNMY